MRRSNAGRGPGPVLLVAVAAVAAVLLTPASFADSPGFLGAAAEAGRIAQVDLRASRVVGFAPMTVVLTGTVRDDQGRRVELGPDAATRLTVVSPSLSLPDGAVHTPLMSIAQQDADSDRPEDPMSLQLLLSRPGKYTVRFLVVDGDQQRLSRPIELHVM